MPVNPNAPFGFREVGLMPGSAPNFGNKKGLIASANNTAIFAGDVLLAPVQAAGYYTIATVTGASGAAIGGVAVNFEWQSISQQQRVRRNYWPGNGDALGDVDVTVCNNPHAIFEVQALLGPIVQADVGKYVNFDRGAGGQTIGALNKSSYSLDQATMNATAGTLPFQIYRLPVDGPMVAQWALAGYDPGNAYNRVHVRMANLVQ